MRSPDYERIAATYDELAVRREVVDEPGLARVVAAANAPVRVLDVGCGTGNWLAAQAAAFRDRVSLAGTDPSRAMLAKARAKVAEVRLVRGVAEQLPFADGRFGWINSRFAFHHFTDKDRALDELVRLLAPGGSVTIVNIAPEHMRGWWVLRFFPEAQSFTDARFWPVERILEGLRARGLATDATIDRRAESLRPDDVLEQAQKRDQSHLASLDDATWAEGVARLERTISAAPGGPIASEMTLARIMATRA